MRIPVKGGKKLRLTQIQTFYNHNPVANRTGNCFIPEEHFKRVAQIKISSCLAIGSAIYIYIYIYNENSGQLKNFKWCRGTKHLLGLI